MKKTKKFAFLSLFSLLLTGCNSTGSASTGLSTGKQPSEAITEPSETPTVTPTEKPTESPTTAGGNSDTSGTESGSTGKTSTSTATQTLWKKSVASRMEKYFDGYIIPYVNIGNYDADSTSKSSTYLSISGSEFDASKMNGFKTTYLDDGWTQTKIAATDRTFEKGAFKVEIIKDSDGYFLVKAYYDVVYDASKAPGAWDQDTLDEIDAEFPNRSIPYLYLGAPVCYTKFASSTKILTIYGYKFDAAIITAAKATFAAPTGKDAAWNSDTIACLKDGRDGYTLPYFYLGYKTPILTEKRVSATANEICTLTGSCWDDSIYTNRKAALQADTKITDWQFRNDYSKRALYGTIYVASGTHVVTTPAVYDDDGVTIVTPEKKETHYITLRLYKDSKTNGERTILEVYYF